jgi:hypothetical protein
MKESKLNTALHAQLKSLSATPEGFSASDVTGYSPEQVRRAAEAMVGARMIVRCKVSARRVRYFSSDAQARAHVSGRPSAGRTRLAAGSSGKASWKPEDPALITPQTRIHVAPPLPRRVFKTNTYQQF